MGKFTVRRYLMFVVSIFVNAFGIAFITKALLGTSPITSVTYVASMFTPLTMGQWTIIVNLLFVVLELFFMSRRDDVYEAISFVEPVSPSVTFLTGFIINFPVISAIPSVSCQTAP